MKALQSQRIDLDPWGTETDRTVDPVIAQQQVTHRFTTYERDANGTDEAMHRRYNSVRSRFEQPDPYDGSYDLSDPQSFNRYSYVQNDPVNFVDPTGMAESWNIIPGFCSARDGSCDGGWSNGGSGYSGHPFDSGYFDDPWGDANVTANIARGILLYEAWRKQQLAEDRAAELLRTENCATYIVNLIGTASPIASSIARSLPPPYFGPIIDENGGIALNYGADYALNEYRRAQREGRVTRSGRSGRAGGTTIYGETTDYSTISWNNEFYNLSQSDQGRQIIHESLHLIPFFNDYVLASAAHILATRGENNPGDRGNFATKNDASEYINQQIANHCR